MRRDGTRARARATKKLHAVAASGISSTFDWTGWTVLNDPIDADEQTDVPWGTRSDYLQPWRAYLDTQPASMMRNALGINFNVPASDASQAAKVLGNAGFSRARLEIPWGAMSYTNPGQLADPSQWIGEIEAMKANGLRPLILLNANDGLPGPRLTFEGTITQTVSAGARTVQLDAATATHVVPGLTGFNSGTGTAAQYIITSVSSNDVATLSQPLPVTVPAGQYPMTTLRYQPFAEPYTASGAPNASFQNTLGGWLLYVKAVTSLVQSVLGNDNFDVEIWNELSFGSDFLDASNYYNPVPASMQGTGDVDTALLDDTVAWLRAPENGVSDIGIGDGFANEDPLVSGSTVPAGVTAIDRHPYYNGVTQMPGYAGSVPSEANVDAMGTQEATKKVGSNFVWGWLPTYTEFFPEYFLTASSTDYLERDLSPITTTIDGVQHGRSTAPAGQSTAPQTWVTETGFRPDEETSLTTAQFWHQQAKSALRTLASFVNKGVTALDFYSADDGDWSMLDGTDPDGGPTIEALQRFMSAFAGPATISDRRSLSLEAIGDENDEVQFKGNGTADHPDLRNLDVVGFFPFQTDSNTFVVPVYVMTRNLDQAYNADSSSVDHFDLPPQPYRFEIGGLDVANLTVSATDPLTGASVPVTIVARSGTTAVIQMPVTDSPRLLELQD